MLQIINIVNSLKNSEIKNTIDKRLKEFEKTRKNEKEIFRELVFCILTAGTSAELGIKTINHLGNTIFTNTQKEIQKKLKQIYRFHTIRSNYIFKARKDFKKINLEHPEVRNHLTKNIKGIGMKEASHFLRNIGFKNYAIIDFHIANLLANSKTIEKPKTLTPKKYLEIENVLKKIAEKTNTNLAELDLYLWYHETGKVLK